MSQRRVMDGARTDDQPPAPQERDEKRDEKRDESRARLITFSDGVFAIAATLLVLELRAPTLADFASQHVTRLDKVTDGMLWSELLAQAPTFYAYALSFLVVGVYWVAHRRVFALIQRVDARVVWLNIYYLLLIALLPFPTELLGTYGALRTPVIIYAATLALCGVVLALLLRHATRHGLVSAAISTREKRYNFTRILGTALIFLLSIPLSFLSVRAAELSWVLIAVFTFVLGRFFSIERAQ